MPSVTKPPIPMGDGTYVGEVRTFASDFPPAAGWLECDGRPLIIANHSQLFEVIANAFGGTDPGKFRVPDLRGAFVRGRNHDKKASEEGPRDPDATVRTIPKGGPQYTDNNDHVGSYQLDELRGHSHLTSLTGRWGDHYGDVFGWGADNGQHPAGVQNIGTSAVGGSESRPSNVSVVFCIRDPDWNKS